MSTTLYGGDDEASVVRQGAGQETVAKPPLVSTCSPAAMADIKPVYVFGGVLLLAGALGAVIFVATSGSDTPVDKEIAAPLCKVTGLGVAALAEGVEGSRWDVVLDAAPALAEPVCKAAFDELVDDRPTAFELVTNNGAAEVTLSPGTLSGTGIEPLECSDWATVEAQDLCWNKVIGPPLVDWNAPTCDAWYPLTGLVNLCKREIIGPPSD